MQRKILLVLATALLGSVTPISAWAAVSVPATPSCAQLATDPANQLAGNAYVVAATATVVPASGSNKAYCNVQMTFSAHAGPTFGYAVGEAESIKLGIGLPLNSTDGGAGGVQGAWNGSVENLGGGGLIGAVGSTTSATNAGYVGSSTDGGHTTAENGVGNFGVIQATHKLDTGKINDYILEAQHQQYVWALALAKHYYGRAATRNYWNGCSTGGRQGLALAEKWGDDFDGFLVGAPVVYLNSLDLGHAWPALINRDEVVGSGHPAITTAQYNAAVASAISACDVLGTDTVADGVVDDPRQCTWSAVNNICGAPNAPAAPNCLDPVQAAGLDKIWDGPRNHDGRRLWHPYLKVMTGGSITVGPTLPSNQPPVYWDHTDLNFDAQNLYSSRALAAANPQGTSNPIALEDEWALSEGPNGSERLIANDDYQAVIDHALNGRKHAKIVMWQGGADPQVFWQDSIQFYRKVATKFGHGTTDFAGMQDWFRYYHAPGVGHCGGGVGASPLTNLPNGNSQIFDDLVKWVENGNAPQSAGETTHTGILATGPGSFGTRPICPWPTTAIYNGSGPTNVATSYTCGGNLDAFPPTAATNNVATLCSGLRTVSGQPTSNSLDYAEQGITPAQCPNP